MSISFKEHADVVIIGSGPTGSAYARTFANEAPHLKLLMLDAGPIIADPPGFHIANIVDIARREAAQIASQGPRREAYVPMTAEEQERRHRGEPDTSMLRRPGLFVLGDGPIDGEGFAAAHAASNVGGMGSHWFGACPRPSKTERVPFIDRETMDDALSTAESYLRVSNTQFPDSPIAGPLETALGEMFNKGRTEDRRVQPMPMALVRDGDVILRSGPDVILGRLLAGTSSRFELRPETVCRRILMEGDRAVGVEIWDPRTGETSAITAAVVVVAADALHTPQLLFASGIRPDALGRNLNEHPQLSVMAEFDGVAPLGIENGPSANVGILADTSLVARTTSGVTWIPYYDEEFPFHVQITQVEPSSLPPRERAIGERKPILSISFFLPSDIDADNRIIFSDTETDWCGRPAMRFRFKLSEGDLARLDRARETMERICARIGRPLEGHRPRTPPNGSSLHYQGTVRMGDANDGRSVCDPNCKVWGTQNIYVAGNGAIPTMTAGNPTLTSVALAILGARSVARQLSIASEAAVAF